MSQQIRQSSRATEAPGPAQLFDAKALGLSLQRLAVDVVKGETTDFMSSWFRSPSGEADLVIWTDGEKRVIKHQLCFYGQVVDWNPINGTRTGLVIEEEVLDLGEIDFDGGEDGDSVAETIRFDRAAQTLVVSQAIEMLGAASDISDDDRATLIFNLRESRKLHARARERALKTWAPKVDELTSTRRPTFWKRLKHWVLGF